MGQDKIMELFMRRHFGKRFGGFGYGMWKNPLVKKHFMGLATKGWITLKRLKIKQY